MSRQLVPSLTLFVKCLSRIIGAMNLKNILGNINAQYATSSHVDLPFEVEEKWPRKFEQPVKWIGCLTPV